MTMRSGCANVIEALRALLAAGFQPKDSVHFHWYVGEEAGLYGLVGLAQEYKWRTVPVWVILELDMTA